MSSIEITILIATICASLAAVGAAVIYYFTLKELRKQRENTSRPHLFIDNISFYVNGIRKQNYLMPLLWSNDYSFSTIVEASGGGRELPNFSLKCYNIGFGTSTNIEIEFFYDMDKFLEVISNLAINIPKEKLIQISRDDTFLSVSCDNKDLPYSGAGIAIDNNLKHYISYIHPVHIVNDYKSIKLPIHYLELLNIYVFYLMTSNGKNKDVKDISVPPITTKIKYLDTNGKKTTSSFTIVTNFGLLSLGGYFGEFVIHMNK